MDSFSHFCFNIWAIVAAAPGWAASRAGIRLEVSKNLIQGTEIKAVYGITILISERMEAIAKVLNLFQDKRKEKKNAKNKEIQAELPFHTLLQYLVV